MSTKNGSIETVNYTNDVAVKNVHKAITVVVSIAALFLMVKLHDREVKREGANRRAVSKRRDTKESCITGTLIDTLMTFRSCLVNNKHVSQMNMFCNASCFPR